MTFLITYVNFNCSGFGLKCQVCGGSGLGLCESKSDNGKSQECQEGHCLFVTLNGKGLNDC